MHTIGWLPQGIDRTTADSPGSQLMICTACLKVLDAKLNAFLYLCTISISLSEVHLCMYAVLDGHQRPLGSYRALSHNRLKRRQSQVKAHACVRIVMTPAWQPTAAKSSRAATPFMSLSCAMRGKGRAICCPRHYLRS